MSIGSIAFQSSYAVTHKQAVSSADPDKNKVPGLKQRVLIVLSPAEDSNDCHLPQSIPAMNAHSNHSSYLLPALPVPQLESVFHEQCPVFVDVHADSMEHGMFTIDTDGDTIERSVNHW